MAIDDMGLESRSVHERWPMKGVAVRVDTGQVVMLAA
jgi:hypothetical protein